MGRVNKELEGDFMEVPIPFGAYTGLPTPFGGPSLEWTFSSGPQGSESEDDDARLGVGGLPVVIIAIVAHIRRIAELYPKSAANVHRVVLCVGIPIIETFTERNPNIANRIDQALMSSDDEGLRELRIRRGSIYPVSLGPQEKSPHSIYARNKSYTSRIRNMAEDIGLPVSKIAILCLVVGLAQSLDPAWVPLKWRESFIQEIQFFEKWLKRGK